MRGMIRFAAAMGLAAALAAPAHAQQGGGRGGMGMMGGFGMLMMPQVQEELKLEEAQVGKVRELGESMREKFSADFEELRDAAPEERREKMQALGRKMTSEGDKALADILKPEQQKRYKQITVQVRGVEAFADEEVQKALKITDEQKAKLGTLASELQAKMTEIRENAQGDFQAAMQDIRAARTAAMDKVKGMLTDEQKSAWTELVGAPFEMRFGGRRDN
jgi:Spy/CpxP family protein refolding chaperone